MSRHDRIPRAVAPTAAFFMAALACGGCGNGNGNVPPADAPVRVRVAAVVWQAVAPPVRGTGILAPKDEITLSFKIGGVIDRVAVDEGAVVGKGDFLAALNLREINARVARAQAAAGKAERDLGRASRLYADSVATLEQVQDAQTADDVAKAALEAAAFDRRYAVITAPADGVILRRFAEPGELAAPGSPVLVFGSRARGSVVRVGLADRDVVRVRVDDPATVSFDVGPKRVVEGKVAAVAAAADPATGTFRVEIAVADAGPLAAGLVAQVEIRPSADVAFPLIPVDALLEADGSRATVFAVREAVSRAERREVTIAFLAGDRVAVASGLDGVKEVVTDGASRLAEGDSVAVIR